MQADAERSRFDAVHVILLLVAMLSVLTTHVLFSSVSLARPEEVAALKDKLLTTELRLHDALARAESHRLESENSELRTRLWRAGVSDDSHLDVLDEHADPPGDVHDAYHDLLEDLYGDDGDAPPELDF
tara:strand:- start:64 stop:450 length:387 start_codon:yes stop_codon:yes gene_type:complete